VGSGKADAQSTSQRHVPDPFVRTKNGVFNINQIERVQFSPRAGASDLTAKLYFVGRTDAIELDGEEAELVRAPLQPRTPVNAGRAGDGESGSRLLMFDDFDGKLGLNWQPVRSDPSHVSLTKNPGKLTITTQRGSIHRGITHDQKGVDVRAKNLYLIDNPLDKGADFVVTTCVSGFTPTMSYQQAGLLIYGDDDNYLKWGYEYNSQKRAGQAFCILTETNAVSRFHYLDAPESDLNRHWLRLEKRGDRYEYSSSTDGKKFRSHGEVIWAYGEPTRLGILAKNGGLEGVTELDAAFESFELRSPAPTRKD
jgi:regulation of enolase protein 1 (concanavalin A-like superfamily)